MKERIHQVPKDLEYNSIEKFPWLNLNQKEMNTKFGYIPLVLTGEFDHSAEVLVNTPRLGNKNFPIKIKTTKNNKKSQNLT